MGGGAFIVYSGLKNVTVILNYGIVFKTKILCTRTYTSLSYPRTLVELLPQGTDRQGNGR